MPTEYNKAAEVLIGVVGNRVEKAELVDESLQDGKQVLLFFNASADPKNTIASEQAAVTDYMKQMQQRCYCVKFNGVSELSGLLGEKLNNVQ